MSHALATDNCFWPTGCSDRGRCNELGHCRRQADHTPDFDKWIEREFPRATGYERDLFLTVWNAALERALNDDADLKKQARVIIELNRKNAEQHAEVLRLVELLRKADPTWGSPMHLNKVRCDADRYRWLITNGRWRASWWQQFGTHEELSKAIDHCMIFGEPRSGSVLAVGEPCPGEWVGPPDASLRQWYCRCGAKRPEQCKTETAKKD